MNYNKFKEDLLAEVRARLPSAQGYEADFRGKHRNHSEYLKICYQNIDLVELPVNAFANQYEAKPDLAWIVEQIQETVCLAQGYPEPEQLKFSYADYDTIKENLAVRLEPVMKEEEAAGSVYEKNALGILSAYYRVSDGREKGWMWTRVPLHMQKFYGVSEKEIIAKGLENTKKSSPLRVYPFAVRGKEPLSLITTFERSYGATAILYPGVQEELRKQMRGGYFLLPLNIHEVLAIKKHSLIKEGQIRMFQKRLLQNTQEKDFLSRELFTYDAKTKSLTACERMSGHSKRRQGSVR